MKRFPAFLCLLVLAAPLCAQNQAKDTPPAKDTSPEFSYDVSFSTSEQTHTSSVIIGYKRLLPSATPVIFDQTVTGAKGLPTKETLSFLNTAGRVLGTLSSDFDAAGKLQSQTLTEQGQAPRALNWFKTGARSPELSVPDSVLKARYALKNGKLIGRTLLLQLPSGARAFHSLYDDLGRRASDSINGPKGPTVFSFFYNESGLVRVSVPATKEDKAKEMLLPRAPDGTVLQLALKEEGILVYRVIPQVDSKGQLLGGRMEQFEAGVLSSATVIDSSGKTLQQETFKNGSLIARKSFAPGANGEQRLLSLDEFEDTVLSKRTQYDEAGAVTSITTFDDDGAPKSATTFQNGTSHTTGGRGFTLGRPRR